MYVIDGYNLMHALRREADLPGDHSRARAMCVEMLAMLARREGETVRIFFDGTPGEIGAGDHAWHGVRVLFCGPERESADREVKLFVENSHEPGQLKVVSSDRAVKDACRLNGATVMSSQDMAARLARKRRNDSEPEPDEKPKAGFIGEAEKAMLDEIGDFEEFERRILDGD